MPPPMDAVAKEKSLSTFSCLKRFLRPAGVSLRKGIRQEEHDGSEAKPERTKREPGGWKTMPFIIGNETFERLAIFGLLANLMVYLRREYHIDQVSATNLINIWSGITNFAPLIGALLSDAYFGRFWIIAFGSLASSLGLLTMTLTAWIPNLKPPKCQQNQHCIGPNRAQLGILLLSLGLLSAGTGGVRPCSIPFGVDQFDHTTKEGERGINSYMNWYYTTLSISAVISFTVLVYVQESVSWALGFGIPTVLMFCSILLFFTGTDRYVYAKPEGSIFLDIVQVPVAAFNKRRLDDQLPNHEQEEENLEAYYDPPTIGALTTKLPLTNQYRCLNKAAIILEGELTPDGSSSNKWRLSSVQQIEQVKCILNVLPIWSTGIICLTAAAQQGTFFTSQAMVMDRHLGKHFQIPPGSISVVSMLTIGLWLPIYDRLIVPKLRKITKHENGITLLQRIGIGLVFSIMCMIVSGLVEEKRRDTANSGTAPLSVLWLTPQLVLLGLTEAFNFIGQIEFYNRQFPENMRSVGTALFFVTLSGASYLSSVVVSVVHGLTGNHGKSDWLTDDMNRGKLDYYYYLLAGMGVVNFIYFLVCAGKYRYKRVILLPVEEEEKS